MRDSYATPSDTHPRTARAPAEATPVAAPVPSTHLLQGRRAIEISHNGFVYRLQATRLGKLILTK